MAQASDNLLLPYIFADIARATLGYYVFNTIPEIPPPWILAISELLKLSIAAINLSKQSHKNTGLWCNVFKNRTTDNLRFAIPAFIGIANRFIYIKASQSTHPKLLQFFWLFRFPATAVAHHLLVRQQGTPRVWSCLIWVCVGLLLFSAPPATTESNDAQGWITAVFAGLLLAANSAISNIVSESLIKSGTFWVTQFWLYAWGTLLSFLLYPIGASIAAPNQQTWIAPAMLGPAAAYIVASVSVSITSAILLRKRDNIAKLVGSIASFLAAMSFLNYASLELRETDMTTGTNLGCLVAAVALYGYNYYQKNTPHFHVWPATSRTLSGAYMIVEDTQHPPISDTTSARISAIFHETTFGLCSARLPTIKDSINGGRSFLAFLLPSFTKARSAERQLRPTAWLDGLRGVAALNVVFVHTIGSQYDRLVINGWNGSTENLFFELPWIRLPFTGHPMVAIFFVISGFSISYRLLEDIHTNNMGSFASHLSSSILRRPFRLFLPCLVITFTNMLMINIGWDHRKRFDVSRKPLSNQFWEWLDDTITFVNPLHSINYENIIRTSSIFNPVLWTIPVEFRGSMIVYLFLGACARLKASARLILLSAMCLFFVYYVYWDVFLFTSGLLFAELHHTHASCRVGAFFEGPIAQSSQPLSKVRLRNAYWVAHFLFATYILSTPTWISHARGEGDPGYVFLNTLTLDQYRGSQHERFWPAVGAVYTVWILGCSPLCQKLFTCRLSQYLGRISYSLYLVHFQLCLLVGEPLLEKTYKLMGKETDLQYFAGFLIGYVPYFMLTIWVADVFTRAVDDRCVKFAKWGYENVVQ